MTTLHRIAKILIPRQGAEHAMSSREISARIGIHERKIRRIISASDDFQPCSTRGSGYFWPASADDIYATDAAYGKDRDAIDQRQIRFRQFWRRFGFHFPK